MRSPLLPEWLRNRQRRSAVLIATAVLTVALLPGLMLLGTDNSPEVFFVRGSESVARYQEFLDELGGGPILRVVVEGDGLWTAAGLGWLAQLEQQIVGPGQGFERLVLGLLLRRHLVEREALHLGFLRRLAVEELPQHEGLAAGAAAGASGAAQPASSQQASSQQVSSQHSMQHGIGQHPGGQHSPPPAPSAGWIARHKNQGRTDCRIPVMPC